MNIEKASATNTFSSGTRLPDIERAKGLAILLVVFGHVVAGKAPAENEWYTVSQQAVYSFHMAFFMFLSGLVFFMRAAPVASFQEYAVSVRKRFMRLMPAYFLFAGLVFAGKWGAQTFLHVDNPVEGFADLIGIALFPMQSVSAFLWYIYVLFLFSITGVALLTLTKGRIWPLVAIGIVLQFVPGSSFLGLGQFNKYFLFFALGGTAITGWNTYTGWVDRLWVLAFLSLAIVLIAGIYTGQGWIIAALLSIPALHGLCRREFPGGRVLLFVGGLTFSIYLMNTMAIGVSKAILLKFVSWDGLNFVFVFLPILMTAGVLIPIAMKKFVFPRIRWLDQITS
ncbi:acyltransferase [Sulfuriferula sp.]|uniref:acyltransferase family protein n=1 Tax=Sulfuriferula sp. TaxID=2025307 RepID=UPI0027307C5F|nr:acyltransferase [Sulfuriferula sp.]MDP2025581.1 acyltransferase [Sulfuriferula sp.]